MRLTEEQKKLLKDVVDHFDKEDRNVRDRQIRVWRKLKLLWDNLHHHYYSEVAHDWRIPETERTGEDTDQSYYDKPVNIFRAYLESIIAALSVTVPPITCYPDDADNPLDLATAKAGDKLAELIFRHNDASLLWIHALFIYCTEGLVACYSYPLASEKFGTYTENKYEEQVEEHEGQYCPQCGAQLTEDEIVSENPNDVDRIEFVETLNTQQDLCPVCGQMIQPEIRRTTDINTKIVGTTQKAKSRICLEVYGGLFIKVPVWATKQKDCPYLIFSYETHFSNVLERYSELRDKIGRGKSPNSYDQYEQWGRLSSQYQGEFPENNVTVRNAWLRPSAFNVLEEEDEIKKLRKLFPVGAKVVLVNDLVADAYNESLDDRWTLTYNPLSNHIHHDPVGLLITSIQDITNDLVSLTLQTIEHGIPQTFADPKVLNFSAYRNQEVIPGGIYPAVPKSGKPLSEGFYEVKTATLSAEIMPFMQKVQEFGQLVSGALPSLFGGPVEGSRTASEYSMSRAQALQRLQTTWKMLTIWWKQVFSKSIPLYISEIREDERDVRRDESGNFVNVFVRKADLEGRIGNIELEANENLPITWTQQRDVITQLLESNNEILNSILSDPESLPYLKKSLGLTELDLPGEDDRQKQHEEITQLVNSTPIVMPPDQMMMREAMMMGMPPPPNEELPSVEVDPDVDNHELEAEICRKWLVSDAGRLCKIENIDGYRNVLLHMKAHKMIVQQQLEQEMMMQAASQVTSGGNPEKPKKPSAAQKPPIQGESDVRTIQ